MPDKTISVREDFASKVYVDILQRQLPEIVKLASTSNCNNIEYTVREIKALDDGSVEVKFIIYDITNKEFVWYFNNFDIGVPHDHSR